MTAQTAPLHRPSKSKPSRESGIIEIRPRLQHALDVPDSCVFSSLFLLLLQLLLYLHRSIATEFMRNLVFPCVFPALPLVEYHLTLIPSLRGTYRFASTSRARSPTTWRGRQYNKARERKREGGRHWTVGWQGRADPLVYACL